MTDQPAKNHQKDIEEVSINSPRITKLSLCNFRAFPGPEKVHFNVSGKNIVVFGENGSGKSSIFHALDGLFSVADKTNGDRKKRLKNAANLFSNEEKEITSVGVEFDDETSETWTNEGHPCDIHWRHGPNSDSRVYPGAYRKAILDYRSLLETNFRHSSGEINLFDVCVKVALRDFRTAYDGSETTIKQLWNDLEHWIDPLPAAYRNSDSVRNKLIKSINAGILEALEKLTPSVNEMMVDMGWADVEIEQFNFSGIRYNTEYKLKFRDFVGKSIVPAIKFKGQSVPNPHLFLNEARLSALALAIYFSARELCAKTNLPNVPKIMVLDDIVVGLDRSNRLPLLNLLDKYFQSWQVFILTHDRVWYDMIRSYHRRFQADKYWAYWELFGNENESISPILLQASASAPKQALDQSRKFLEDGHINASGNAARIAAERAVREFCETKGVPVPYKNEIEKVPFSDILAGASKWSKSNAHGVYDSVLNHLKMYTQILLNKLSHGGTPELTKHEVQGAIAAVDALLLALRVTSKYE